MIIVFLLCASSADEVSGGEYDVKRITRQLLNRAVAHRTIPKQECMVEVGQLDLVLCSEKIEPVSISGCYKLQEKTHYDIVSKYRRDIEARSTMSLAEYFGAVHQGGPKIVIPHWIGGNSQPVYPVTDNYARSTLLIHRPWMGPHPPSSTSGSSVVVEFNKFIRSAQCPRSVLLAYTRVKDRFYSKRDPEAVQSEECYDNGDVAAMDDETRDILSIVRTTTTTSDPTMDLGGYKMDKGLNYDWSERIDEVSQ